MNVLSSKLIPMFYRYKYIIAYRIEDKNGDSPYAATSEQYIFDETIYPDFGEYKYAYLYPTSFLEPELYSFYKDDKYTLYEYFLCTAKCFISCDGVVCYCPSAVISRAKLRKGRI